MVRLSVVIPTFNRHAQLLSCLEALSRQTEPARSFEVIVAVDGSTDRTLEMLQGVDMPYPLRVIWQENRGQPSARNRGLAAAEGQYCLFLDDDVLACPSLIAEHLRFQEATGGAMVIGGLSYTPPPRADWFTRCFAREWHAHYEGLQRRTRGPAWTDCYGGNLSAPVVALREIGGFTTDLAALEDLELGFRFEAAGRPLVYAPGACGEHCDYKGLRELFASSEKEAAAAVELCRRYPAMRAQLIDVPSRTGPRLTLLRRALRALKVPPRALSPVGSLFQAGPWGYEWYRFVRSYCYWRGVTRAPRP